MTTIAALLAGLVFGLGLIVSGLADPAKVLAFVLPMLAGMGLFELLERRGTLRRRQPA
jgi:hypothetical protein